MRNHRKHVLTLPCPCRLCTDIEERKIPLTPGVDPLDLLTNDGNNAKMTSEGLPADRISLENGSVITNCKRWPLIIDPQQQVHGSSTDGFVLSAVFHGVYPEMLNGLVRGSKTPPKYCGHS